MTVIEKLENNIAEVNSAFQNIKSKIVENGVEVAENTRPIELAPKVNEVFEAGKKAEYDEFWDAFQAKGTLTNYNFAFSGKGWNEKNFFPRYDMRPTLATYMFRDMHNTKWSEWDLVEHLEKLGVELDFSGCTDMSFTFHWAISFSRLGIIDISKATSTTLAFGNCTKLHTIEKLITSETVVYTQMFTGDTKLVNITVEGTIAKNGFDTSPCVALSRASIISIINALSTNTSGLTVTLSKTAVETAFGSVESAEWQSLIAPKSNWTISLI